MSSMDENKEVIRRLAMAFNQNNLNVIDELIAPDFVLHANAMVPQGLRGPENSGSFACDCGAPCRMPTTLSRT